MTNTNQQLDQAVRHINKHFGYSFDNHALLKQALTHRSAAKAHNERLEFLGDAILGMVIDDPVPYTHIKLTTRGTEAKSG